MSTGSNNIAVGYNAGSTYVGAEASNICIGSAGETGDGFTSRLGTPNTA